MSAESQPMSFSDIHKPESSKTDFADVVARFQSVSWVLFLLAFYVGFPALIVYLGLPKGTAAIAGLAALGLLIYAGTESLKKWLIARRPCAHAISGGLRGACQACKHDAEVQQQQMQAETENLKRKKTIREIALELRSKEIKRLSTAWLTEANSYVNMSPRQFEDAIAELFRRLGYKVQQTPFSNDGGKDAIAWKDGKKFLIECKRFSERTSVGRRDVQILHSAVVDAKAERGIFVTTGSYAHTAVEYAKKNNLEIYDGAAIPWLVSQAYGSSQLSSSADVMCYECGATISLPLGETTPSGTCKNGHEVLMNITLTDLGVAHLREPHIPMCPRCGSSMRKINKLGRRPFWSCSTFPECRGTKPVSGR